MAKAQNWISETEAAQKVDRAARTLRRYVKKGKWNVAFRTLNGRTFQYDAKDLESLFQVKKSA